MLVGSFPDGLKEGSMPAENNNYDKTNAKKHSEEIDLHSEIIASRANDISISE